MAYLFALLFISYLHSEGTDATQLSHVTVGGDTILPCHTNLSVAVDWWYQPTLADIVQQVCMNGAIVVGFRDRFSVNSSRPGDYSLHIKTTKMSDAGFYTCVEDAGLSTRHVRQLTIVTVTSPNYDNSTTQLIATLTANVTDAVSSSTPAVIAPTPAKAKSTTQRTTTASTRPPQPQKHASGTLNKTVTLPCRTTLPVAVDWWYQSSSAETVQQVCMNGEIVVTHRDRFSMSNSSQRGDYSLLIKHLLLSDAGLYTCVEDAGLSTRHVINLTVTDSISEKTSDDMTTTVISGGDQGTSMFNVIIASAVATAIIIVVILIAVSCVVYRRRMKRSTKTNTEEVQELNDRNTTDLNNDNRALRKVPIEYNDAMACCMKKCAAKLFIAEMKNDPDADLAAMNILASVCRQWWEIVSDASNKQQIKRTLGAVCHPYRRHPKSITTIETDEIVSTVACFDGNIYVVDSTFKYVAVYRACYPFDRQLAYNINEIKQVTDMVAWESQRSLFLADYNDGTVWKLNAVNGRYLKWFAGHQMSLENLKPCCLSVYHDQLFIALSDNTVRSFGPKCNALCRVDLGDNVNLFYTVAHPISGEIITFATDYTKPQIAANKLRVFNKLFHLTFDAEGRAFCYGFREPNIYLRNAKLRKHRIVLHDDREEKSRLTGLCYMQSSGLLLVYESNLIRIYSVRKCS